jgi:hypothetical protein
MERRVFNEDGGTSTVEDNIRRMKSAGRHASSTSAVEDVAGVIYCKDCLNCSILQLAKLPPLQYPTVVRIPSK